MASKDIKSIVKSVQKFDGTSNVESFISRLKTAIATFSLKSKWVILNFHLFIEGEVEHWWKWAQTSKLDGLDDTNMDVRVREVYQALKEFYEPESVKQETKKASARNYTCSCRRWSFWDHQDMGSDKKSISLEWNVQRCEELCVSMQSLSNLSGKERPRLWYDAGI